MSSQMCGSKAEYQRNNVQNDVMNNTLTSDNVHVKQPEGLTVNNCTEHEKVTVNKQGSSQGINHQTSDVLNEAFIVQFKEKRRRALLEKLRNMRGKEKLGSCAIMLFQFEKLKSDIRKLSAAKLRRGQSLNKNTNSEESPKNNEVRNLQNPDQLFENSAKDLVINNQTRENFDVSLTNEENTMNVVSSPRFDERSDSAIDRGRVRNSAGSHTDANVISMEISDSDEMHSRRLFTVDGIEDASCVFSQDSTKEEDTYNSLIKTFRSRYTKPRPTSNHASVDSNSNGRATERHIGSTPNTSHDASTRASPDVIGSQSCNMTQTSAGVQKTKDVEDFHANLHIQEKNNSILNTKNADEERDFSMEKRGDTELTARSSQECLLFDGVCGAEENDSPNTAVDFDSILHQAKRKFKFQLMIQSQDLLPRQFLDFPLADSPHSTRNYVSEKSRGNYQTRTASQKGFTTPKSELPGAQYNRLAARSNQPVNQPHQDPQKSGGSEEERRLQKELTNVLKNLTKSQLDILQTGSPRLYGHPANV